MNEKEREGEKDGRRTRGGPTVREAVCESVGGDSRKSEAPRKRFEFPLLIAIIILPGSNFQREMLPTYLPLPSHQGGNHPRLRAEISRNNVGSDASNERGWLADVSSVLYAKFDDVMRITSSFLFFLLSTTHTD